MLGLYRNCKSCKYSSNTPKQNIRVSRLLPANRNSVHLDSNAGRSQAVEKFPYTPIMCDMTSKERSCTSRGTDESQALPLPGPKLGQRMVKPSLPKLLNRRTISSVNSLPTNRHSNCPYKTNSMRFSVPRMNSTFSNQTPHGNGHCTTGSCFNRSPSGQAETKVCTTCRDLGSSAPEDQPFVNYFLQLPLPLASTLAFPQEMF